MTGTDLGLLSSTELLRYKVVLTEGSGHNGPEFTVQAVRERLRRRPATPGCWQHYLRDINPGFVQARTPFGNSM